MALSPARVSHAGTPVRSGGVTASDVLLRTSDGVAVAARLWECGAFTNPVATALINSGAGISSRYYDHFASYLASSGIATLVYDYRGIGRSRPESLRGFYASVEEWGSKDCAAGLDWLALRFRKSRRIVIGHSVGGFVTGFAANAPMIDQMLLVGAHNGYWRDYDQKRRMQMFVLWHLLMPVVTRAVGFFPGRALRLLEDLPMGVAIEWANRRKPEFWWNVRTADGERDRTRIDAAMAGFRAVHARTLAVRLTDDPFGTIAATDRILSLYGNCPSDQLIFSPEDASGQKIGHFGFFRSRFRQTLWPPVLHWLLGT